MSFPRYPAYKDTGIRWLGQVPTHWRLAPLWSCFRRTKRTGFEDEVLLSVYRDYGVIPKASRDDNFNKPSDDLSAYQLVTEGDLVVNKMKAWQGSVAISDHRGIVSPAYFVYESLHEESPRFFHYLMRSDRYITGYLSISEGVRVNQWDMDPALHSRMPLLIPSKDEQEAITDLLDRETAKIDALVAEQEQLITLLKEKRQAVISHAVTKGLDPSVPMQDSGVEWLGEVPEHWEVTSLKRHWTATDCKHVTAEFVEDGFPLASIREVQSRWVELADARRTTEHYYELLIEGGRNPRPGDLIFSRNATVGEVAQVPVDHPPFAMGQDVVLLRRIEVVTSPDFLQLVIRSSVVTQQLAVCMIGSTFKRINVEEIRSLVIAFPPANEQREISTYVIQQAGQFDQLIEEAVLSIELLRERRSALISAAVTGQIDVRGLATAKEAA